MLNATPVETIASRAASSLLIIDESASARTLCFVMDEFSVRKGVEPQQVAEVSFLPTKSGPYKFYCPVQEIQGKLTVRD